MKLIIEIEMDNAAWGENPFELREVLEKIRYKIEERNIIRGFVLDSNGNRTATFIKE